VNATRTALLALALLAPPAAGASPCALGRPGSDAAPARDCASCHGRADAGMNHPVDLDYRGAQLRPGSHLRPLEEVVRRGVLLPDGEVRCTTCHDGRSPWKYRLAIPPGAAVRPAIDLRDRRTYEAAVRPVAASSMPPGSDVGRKALCIACHALD
jgi:hypothetical protein